MVAPSHSVYISSAVAKVIALHQPVLSSVHAHTTIQQQLGNFAENLLFAHRNGDVASLVELKNWHPSLVRLSDEQVMNTQLNIHDSRLAIAREHGYDNWEQVDIYGCQCFDLAFEAAIDALIHGQFSLFCKMLKQKPSLVNQRSPYRHQAQLIHYVGSNGVEIRRQCVPMNLPKLTRQLIDYGADVNATAHLYGGPMTTLQLLSSSAHPKDAGIATEMIQLLKRA